MAGRSGGHNRLSVAHHRLHGTYRADRHAPRVVEPKRPTASRPASAPRALLEGLGPAGRRFVRAAFAGYEIDAVEQEILRVCALSLDDAAAAREKGDLKAARAATRQFLQAMQRLGLPMVWRG